MIKLPFGAEFSPSQIDLPRVLEICKENEGNNKAIEKVLLDEYFTEERYPKAGLKNRKTLAYNSRLGAKNYQLIDKNGTLTDTGNALYLLRNDNDKLYSEFAKHILLNLNGMGYIEYLNDAHTTGEDVTLEIMRDQLELRGIKFPSGGRSPSSFRLWLVQAGILAETGSKQYVPDNERIAEILGADKDVFSGLSTLSLEQRYFLLALLNTGKKDFQPAADIRKLASVSYGIKFKEKSLPKSILNDIEKAGFITTKKATKGRGAKSHLVKPTDKAIKEIVEPLINQLKEQTDPRLIRLLRKSIPDILKELESSDKNVKGLALEALAFKIMTILGLKYIGSRIRSAATADNEVDLLFYSDSLTYSLWQIQCKNTKSSISNDQVAREVGVSKSLCSNIIVIITTSSFSSKAVKFANDVMKKSNLDILFIDGDDITRIAENPASIVAILEKQTKAIVEIKKSDSIKQ